MDILRKKWTIALSLVQIILLTGCATVDRVYISSNDRTDFLTVRVFDKEAQIVSDQIPGITIIGTLEEKPEGNMFSISRIELFSNWAGGWTEGEYEASGLYLLEVSEDGNLFIFREKDPFELWDIAEGEIRYKDNYYRGNDGLWKVKNRVDRIGEVTRWMHDSSYFAGSYENPSLFEEDVIMTLFPELHDFDKLEKEGLLAEDYYNGEDMTGEEHKGAGISWRIGYTEAVFPTEFHELRNSGSIWRDFEEAPDLFYSFFNLDSFLENTLKDHVFTLGEK